jgi:hypothetical protein
MNIWGAVTGILFAALVTPAQGMTFIIDKPDLKSADPSVVHEWYVYGSGEIVADDAARLLATMLLNASSSNGQSQNTHLALETIRKEIEGRVYVYLDSPGGSLHEGMQIGRLLSRLKAHTNVGRRTQAKDGKITPAPGKCSSACVWAYLGGRYRFLLEDSKIGVHQFAFSDKSQVNVDVATAITQEVAADILKFIKENRADPEFFSLMTRALPAEIYFVPPQKLRELRVVTDDIYDENWSFEISQEDKLPYLRIWQQSMWGENKLLLTCSTNFLPATSGKTILGSALLDRGNPPYPAGPFTVGLVLDGDHKTIPEKLIIIKPKMQGKYMTSWFVVEANLASRMLTAEKIGATIVPPRNKDKTRYYGFLIGTAKGRDKLSKLIQGCNDPDAVTYR